MRQPPGHGVTRCALAIAEVAPLIGLDDPARQNRTIRGESLAGDFGPKLVKAAERSHVGVGEGNPAGDLDAYPATDAERAATAGGHKFLTVDDLKSTREVNRSVSAPVAPRGTGAET